MPEIRKDAARNRARILEAARVMSERGEPLALNAVAKTADVGVGTVYRHFATVDELEEVLTWSRFDELSTLLADSGEGRIERLLTTLFEIMATDGLFESVTTRTTPALQETTDRRDALFDELDDLLRGARESGRIRGDVDARGVVALVCGIAHSVRAAALPTSGARATTLLRVVFDGLRPPRPSNRSSA